MQKGEIQLSMGTEFGFSMNLFDSSCMIKLTNCERK